LQTYSFLYPSQGGPVDAFAVQGQFTQVTPFLFRYGLDKLGQFGIPIWMSEINLRLTVDPYSEQSQRDFMELILREAYAHPAVSVSDSWSLELTGVLALTRACFEKQLDLAFDFVDGLVDNS
jgi:hypothetical protein